MTKARIDLVELAGQLSNQLSTLGRGLDQASVAPIIHPKAPVPQPQRRLTSEEIGGLLSGYEAGSSTRELARDLGVHRFTVVNHLRAHDVETRPNVRKLSDHQVIAARQMYDAGNSLKQVGNHFGVDAQTVRRELAKIGASIRPRRGWPPSLEPPGTCGP